jgi:MOSC domain-containing protein
VPHDDNKPDRPLPARPVTVGTVAGAWHFPVKSLQGEAVDALVFDATGAVGDRTWGIVDQATGKVLTAKRWGVLLEASARLEAGGDVVVTLPDGREHAAGVPGTDEALSAWLDRDVRLSRPPEGGLPYELTMDPTDDESAVWDFATPPASFVDLAAAHLLTNASLEAGRRAYPAGDWDVRRFRPSLLIAAAGTTSGYEEDSWISRNVACGEVVFEPFMPTPRCAMPTRSQPGLARDTAVSRTLTDHHDNNLGIYAQVVQGGCVRIGDDVALA